MQARDGMMCAGGHLDHQGPWSQVLIWLIVNRSLGAMWWDRVCHGALWMGVWHVEILPKEREPECLLESTVRLVPALKDWMRQRKGN